MVPSCINRQQRYTITYLSIGVNCFDTRPWLEARGKPVVYCGDLNVAHTPLDLWGNHAAAAKGAGYTPEERAAFGGLLVGSKTGGGLGLVDSFRSLHPDATAYSYFSYRGGARPKNRGWRLDYCLAGADTRPLFRST
jgi:exodeoxyribonuclease III